MDLADRGGRERGEIVRGAPAIIGGAHIYIVDIAQDAASGARRHAGKEFPFRDRRMAKAQAGGRMLDENSAPQVALHLVDMPTVASASSVNGNGNKSAR